MVLNETGKDSIVIRKVDSKTFLNFVQISTIINKRNTASHQIFQKKQVIEKIKTIEDTNKLAIFLRNFKTKLLKPTLFFVAICKNFFKF